MTKINISTSAGKLAESEFGIVNFGDIRLSKRLLKIVNIVVFKMNDKYLLWYYQLKVVSQYTDALKV